MNNDIMRRDEANKLCRPKKDPMKLGNFKEGLEAQPSKLKTAKFNERDIESTTPVSMGQLIFGFYYLTLSRLN